MNRLLNWIRNIVLGGVAIIAVCGGYVAFDEWNSARDKEKVQIVAKVWDLCKTKEFPIFVGVVNKSSKTVNSVSVDLKVTHEGHSTQLNRYNQIKIDKVLKPGEGWGICVAQFHDDYSRHTVIDMAGKEVTVDHYSVYFKN